MAHIVNMIDFAKIRGCSARTIRNYIKAGMPATGLGKKGAAVSIDTELAIDWLIEHAIDQRVAGLEGGATDIAEARLLKIQEEHRKLKLENDESERQLLPADDVRQAFSAALVELGGLLDGAAGKMASGDAVLRQRLLDEHRRIRTAYADRLAAFGVVDNQTP